MTANFENQGGILKYNGPRPADASEAFDISIAKWEYLVESPIQDGGCLSCGLCMLQVTCEGCPVKEETGKGGCSGTPYSWYHSYQVFGDDEDKLKEVAQEELDFLRNLREKLGV